MQYVENTTKKQINSLKREIREHQKKMRTARTGQGKLFIAGLIIEAEEDIKQLAESDKS